MYIKKGTQPETLELVKELDNMSLAQKISRLDAQVRVDEKWIMLAQITNQPEEQMARQRKIAADHRALLGEYKSEIRRIY